jgi:parallel beta-helix repeat protein
MEEEMKRSGMIFTVVLALLQFCCSTMWARQITAYEAQQTAKGWLRVDPQPLDTVLGRQVAKVETFNDDDNKPVYYIVYLQPAGFVIMPADDLVEPVVGFADDGTYDPSPANPLGALVTNDLNGRITAARNAKGLEAPGGMEKAVKSQAKWTQLVSLVDSPEDGLVPQSRGSISDVRVAPLVQSRWSQTTICSIWPSNCYNNYTPGHYPCGCVATAMAQLMRYYQHPTSGIGVHEFTITVDGVSRTAYTRGGDGSGGPYRWSKMVLVPDCLTMPDEREAIGALCYDAGVSVNMDYASDGSSAYADSPRYALTNTFQYHNAVVGVNGWVNIGPGLIGMVNPNLDARSPVILSISRTGGGHAVVCDGYGYDSSTLYHHLNMGWAGSDDAWYNLPNIDSSPAYNCVDACIYNIRTTGGGDGEVISGRVLYANGDPIPNTTVSTVSFFFPIFTNTNSIGIYAFSDLKSNTSYRVTAFARGYISSSQVVTTGTSQDNQPTSGNVGGVDFILTRLDCLHVDDDAPGDPGPGNPTVSAPLEDGSIQHPFDSIQEAIDVAINGNEIEVAPGTYNEAVNFSGKAICLYSSGGPEVTTINGTGHYHVVQCVNHEVDNTILDGFRITGGNANGSWPHDCGGGMYNERSNPTIIDCNFTGNRANTNGGGMYSHIYNDQKYGNQTVVNCTFSNNTAYNGGGMCNDWYVNAQITNCTFSGNTASHNGGGMCNISTSNPTVTNCNFIGDTSNLHGGGMYNNASSPKLTNCIFSGNTAGGHGGGMINSVSSSPTVTNCTFSGNTAGLNGDGMFNNDNSNPIVTNCIFWGNTPEEISILASTPIVTYSDVRGGWFGAGNINANPLFVDAIAGDLRLTSGSPCIDKGSNAAVPPGITTDLEGHPRIIDGDCDDIDVVDIGAYEFDLAYFGDFDNNCSVNFFDFSILARAWMTQEGEPGWDWVCDISDPPDNYIDWRDLAVLCDNWLTTP